MLIYKGMNVFPTAIRDLITRHFPGQVTPSLRLWKTHADQVRFDDPIAVDVEACERLSAEQSQGLARAIENEVRAQLQIRIAVHILEPGGLPQSAYKNSLIAVRAAAPASSSET